MDTRTALMDPRRALGHPLWWASLALLALNDHLLKGAGLAPAWLTGKLSDFAGLVVAPALLAVLAGARTRAAVFAAFATVTVAFVAVKTSLHASDLYVGALGHVGLRARNACDPTDLVALLVLPLSWRLCLPTVAHWTRASAQRLAITLSSIACVATSRADPPPVAGTWQTRAWVANATSSPVELRLRWAHATTDCSARVDWAQVLGRSVFQSEPLVVRVAAQQTFPLDRAAALAAVASMPTDNDPDAGRGCDAVLIQSDNLPTTVLRWGEELTQSAVPTTWSGSQLVPDGGFVIEGSATALTVTAMRAGGSATAAPPVDEAVACAETEHFFVSFDASAWSRPRALTRVERLPDGCTRIEGDASVAVLCVPAAAVPFREGDQVTVVRSASGWSLRSARGPSMEVVSGTSWNSGPGASATRVLCEGHSACGAWVRRYGLGLGGDALMPGEVGASGGFRVFFAGAEEFVVRPDACGGPAASARPDAIWYDLVFVEGA